MRGSKFLLSNWGTENDYTPNYNIDTAYIIRLPTFIIFVRNT